MLSWPLKAQQHGPGLYRGIQAPGTSASDTLAGTPSVTRIHCGKKASRALAAVQVSWCRVEKFSITFPSSAASCFEGPRIIAVQIGTLASTAAFHPD